MKRAVLLLILIMTGCVPMQSRVYPTETSTPEMLIVRRSDPTPRANPTAVIAEVNYMATAMAIPPEIPTETAKPCNIKGNVNSKGEKYYHCPNFPQYATTKVDPSEGDRWFCSEAEAIAAGFHAPDNGGVCIQ